MKMWCNSTFNMLLLTIVLFTSFNCARAVIYSNSTALTSVPDDVFFGMPVYFKSNMPIKALYSKERMRDHINRILTPLAPFIMNGNTRIAQRRQDGGDGTVVQLEQYDLPFIAAAQIGTYTFTCRQSNGDLVIYNPTLAMVDQFRSIPSFTEFQIHPRPGIWWWVQCVTFETGGAGMGITGVQKPGGDAGIDPNALKSLVG